MKKAITTVLLCVPLAGIAQVAAFGGYDCGQWANPSNMRPLPARAWLLGYLSGVNAAMASKSSDPLGKIGSAEQIYLWMDNYCRSNPLKGVGDGSQELYLELQKK